MAEDSPKPDDKSAHTPPPPDIPKAPAPPAASESPKQETAAPPAQDEGASAAGESAPQADKGAPGADASIGNRIVATILDGLVAAGINILAGFVLSQVPFVGFIGNLSWVLGAAYLLTRDSLPFLGGQSIGKKAMKIRAVTMDGQPLTGNWQVGAVRNVPLVIPIFPLVELIVMLTRQDKPGPLLRLGDEWAKTKVVNAAPAAQS